MKIKFKKLHGEAVTPAYSKYGDAGLDISSITYTYDSQTKSHIHTTGIAIEIPYGFVGLIFPRSSISKKTQLLSNSVGVIDSGYRGEIKFVFKNTDVSQSYHSHYQPGDRIGQLVIIPIPLIELDQVTELSDSERGSGSYGSTGA